ncbi:DRTGG domain-containing protein [Salinicoccus carnicancri]|uniref:DRTGG domain-containing protein n=1 Tax=Salinicoccus carnicancri TaxID=558170 RepID=UPI0002E1837E|nr:DRTGG domain-containing protein [Salinicoccus carnicancri]
MSKHDEILEYIHALPEGAKISVRQISANLDVSDGTSYRAIKSAEKEGLVKTIERVGTIRVAPRESAGEGNLTFQQVNRVIQGTILAGRKGMAHEITRFIIGAMRTEALETYLEKGALLIVGNREDAQWRAMDNRSGVLITGGFGPAAGIMEKAESLGLPVISTSADTFSVASVIQRELYSRSLMSNVVTADDLVVRQEKYVYDLKTADVREYIPADKMTVLVEGERYIGTIRSSDISSVDKERYSEWLQQNIEVLPSGTLQTLRQVMSWHQLNIVPVVDRERRFLGVVHRRDVFREFEPRKLSTGMSSEEVIDREIRIDENRVHMKVMPFMTDEYGSITQSAFMRLIERLTAVVLKSRGIHSYHMDSLNLVNVKLVQLNQEIVLEGNIIDLGDQFLRLEVETSSEGNVLSKAMLMIQHYSDHKK